MTTTKPTNAGEKKMTRSQSILAGVRARIRKSGCALFTVSGISPEGKAWTSESLCAHDARVLELEQKFNGWTNVTVNAR